MSVRFLRSGVAVVACLIGLIPAAAVANGTNSRVTRDSQAGSYTRYDGSTDATMMDCSINKRAQHEPTVAVDRHNTNIVVAKSNDYCAATVNGYGWAGYYRPTTVGTSWYNGLDPDYPA